MKQVLCFEDTEQINVTQIGDEDCLIDFNGQRIVMSYEATYDLAIRLASFIHKVGDDDDLKVVARSSLN